jgi:hypothetical protein
MSIIRTTLLFMLAFGFFLELDPPSLSVQGSWMSTAQAIVGAPATPMSVAGVARRTTRRCVTGVYNC